MDYLPSFKSNKNRQPPDSEQKNGGKAKDLQQNHPTRNQTPRINTSRTSTSSLHPSPRSPLSPSPSLSQTIPLPPNTDPLPTTHPALEGHLNHHASQLQILADRAEMINEWIDMDGIVLARLKREVERAAVAVESGLESDCTEGKGEEGIKGKEGGKVGQEDKGEREREKKKKMVDAHNGIAEIWERIAGMRRWRKEVERAVVWQREEGWRVEEKMGRGRGREKEKGREDGGVDGGGNGERRWSVRGKVPSQREWEGIFCRE
ncbi:MAG: hypothetical protein L6R36_007387 [Xanthoria steineri]|nr:MAG: hypothetical protein L6R36_007387 [Xanthoria steineri]